MRVQVGRGLRTGPQADVVDEVGRHHRVDRTEIHVVLLPGGRRLHIVLHKGTHDPYNPSETLLLRHVLHHRGHAGFGTRQRVGAVLRPELLVLDFRDALAGLFPLLEPLVGNGREVEARISGGAPHQHVVELFQGAHLGNHVVLHQNTLPVGQGGKILLDDQVADEVHARADGQVHQTALHPVGAVVEHPQASREAKVLRVLRQESQLDALVAVHHQGIHDIILVKGNGVGGRKRAGEVALQQVDGVVVDVHVREEALQHGGHDVAGGEQLVQAFGVRAAHEVALRLGLFPVDVFRRGLVVSQRQDVGLRLRAILHLLEKHGILPQEAAVHEFLGDVVEAESDALVLVITVIIVFPQIVAVLGGNDLAHQRHGGIVLAAIPPPLGLHHQLREFAPAVVELHVERLALSLLHIRLVRAVSHIGKDDRVALQRGPQGVSSVDVRNRAYMFLSLVIHIHGRQGVARLGVGHHSLHLAPRRNGDTANGQQDKQHISLIKPSQHILLVKSRCKISE